MKIFCWRISQEQPVFICTHQEINIEYPESRTSSFIFVVLCDAAAFQKNRHVVHLCALCFPWQVQWPGFLLNFKRDPWDNRCHLTICECVIITILFLTRTFWTVGFLFFFLNHFRGLEPNCGDRLVDHHDLLPENTCRRALCSCLQIL